MAVSSLMVDNLFSKEKGMGYTKSRPAFCGRVGGLRTDYLGVTGPNEYTFPVKTPKSQPGIQAAGCRILGVHGNR